MWSLERGVWESGDGRGEEETYTLAMVASLGCIAHGGHSGLEGGGCGGGKVVGVGGLGGTTLVCVWIIEAAGIRVS